MQLETIDLSRIRALRPRPCYDPTRYLEENWTGTVLDILDVSPCPPEDRIWVVVSVLPEREQRLAACAFVRYTPLTDGRTVWDLLTDERSRMAIEVAERYAQGEPIQDELSAARVAANDAAAACWNNAKAAAKAAVHANARIAAKYAGEFAASAVAKAAASPFSIWDSENEMAFVAARNAQLAILRDLIMAECGLTEEPEE